MVRKITILYVLEPFLYRPKAALHLAEISKLIKHPHPTVRQDLNFLEEKGLLKKQIKGRLTLYALNLDSPNLTDYLTIAEKNRLIKRCEEELLLKDLVYFLHALLGEQNKALIFGSATESLKKANDVDLLVIGKLNQKKLEAFSEKLDLDIHLINLSKLGTVSEPLRQEIIKKHLLIEGSEEIVRWLLS
jgi:DNA-binding transcriptional ArsR family regulator